MNEYFDWNKSISAYERLNILGQLDEALYDMTEVDLKIDLWDRFVNSGHFKGEDDLLNFLAALNTDKEKMILALSIDLRNYIKEPVWSVEINEILNIKPQKFDEKSKNELAEVLASPFVTFFADKFKRRLEKICKCHDFFSKNSILKSFEEDLLSILSEIIKKCVIAMLGSASEQDLLQGNTSHKRYENFKDFILTTEGARTFYDLYPRLAKIMYSISFNREDAYIECIERFLSDYDEIKEYFFDKNLAKLVSINSTGGDLHNSGRSVLKLTFEDQENIIYKPRSLRSEEALSEFIELVNILMKTSPLPTVKNLTRKKYGWQEFVKPHNHYNLKETEEFYYLHGIYLGALKVVGLTDIHFENVIASKDGPVIIDAEALFYPIRTGDWEEYSQRNGILDIGLLPHHPPFCKNEKINLSALGSTYPFKEVISDEIIDPFTDRIHLEKRKLKVIDHSIPLKINDNIAEDPSHYLNQLIRGYNEITNIISNNKEVIQAFLDKCKESNFSARYIIRKTATYSSLLKGYYHPDSMIDGLSGDIYLQNLWPVARSIKDYQVALSHEIESLLSGDIPIFDSFIDEENLYCRNLLVDKNFFSLSGIKAAQKRLAPDSNYKSREIYVIKSCMTSNPFLLKSMLDFNKKDTLINEAERIFDILDQVSETNGGYTWWNGLYLEESWTFGPLSINLYDGLSGLAVFIKLLGHSMKDEKITAMSQRVMAASLKTFSNSCENIELGGTHYGASSFLYSILNYFPDMLQEEFLSEYIDMLSQRLFTQDQMDFISGLAGNLLINCSAYSLLRDDRLLDIIQQQSSILFKRINSEVELLDKTESSLFLAGISHGRSGFALALTAAGKILQSEEFSSLAFDLVGYENRLYDDNRCGWIDRRTYDKDDIKPVNQVSSSWCNGASGIGLARCGIYTNNPVPLYLDDIKRARDCIIGGHSDFKNGSLCHGLLGNLLALRSINGFLNLKDDSAEKYLEYLDSNQSYWSLGTPENSTSLAFMNGLSGIGFALISLYEQCENPTMLDGSIEEYICK